MIANKSIIFNNLTFQQSNMKPTITTILIMLFSFLSCLYFPWWSIAVVAFLVVLVIPQRPWASFLTAFFALFILWGFLSLIISINNGNILADRVSLLIFKTKSTFLLILVTALIGALVAGLGGLTASFLRTDKKIPTN